jgi:anhydro-N-acetylmuramic acid kinase
MVKQELQDSKSFEIIGIMSGTSLDGVDIAHCTFEILPKGYNFRINVSETIPYSLEWQEILKSLPSLTALDYASMHVFYGKHLGQLVHQFLQKYKMSADFVASHGHTVFHQPEKMFTSQVGDGAALAAECGIPVICDFRSGDVAHGGQGAPLVPIGDELLFPGYAYCLNLGGFANISFNRDGKRQAFDVCPANFILNHLAGLTGHPFDKDGEMASSGNINPELLQTLNALPFYAFSHPKSLGREWVEKEFLPILNRSACSTSDKMRTAVEHIVSQVRLCTKDENSSTMLVTGGGAMNRFLVDRLKESVNCTIVIPGKDLIEFKEALIFAFLGLLRILHKPNCLRSVTGATNDVCSGAIYLP